MNRVNCMFLAVCCAAFAASAETVLQFTPSATGAQTTESIPTDVSSPATGAFTWEAWFKASDLTLAENRMVAQTGWAWNNEGRLVLEIRKHSSTGGNPKLAAFYRYNSATVRLCGPTTIGSGWHHAALVRSGTDIALYLDGALEASTNNYVNATPSGVSTAPFLIGPAFYGSLAEVRLWNVARTAAEIAAAKDARLVGTETNLVGYWPLDEGTSTVTPTNIVTGVAATPVSASGVTVGYNQGAGTAAYADDAGLALTPVPVAGTVYTTTAAGGKWSEIAWTPSLPVSGTGARIVLAGAGAFENDLGTFALNALTFSAAASLSGDGLVFAASDGTNPTLATTGAVTNDVNVAMRLDAPLTWTGDDRYGSLRLNGPLSGTGDLIHDPTAVNIIDYINGDNSAWSGNLDQRLSYIVISNSVNLGTGTYYCTNETCRVRGRDTLRIYGNNTITNRFYLGSEGGGGAEARVDIFGVTTFTEPFGVYNTRVGILDVTTFEGGIYNWASAGNNAVFQSGTGNAAKGVVHINGPLNIRGVLYCNAQETSNCKLTVYLHSPTNVFAGFQGIRGGVLAMGCEGCYPTNAYFCGQTMTSSRSYLGGVLELNGYSQVLGYHAGSVDSLTNSSFKIRNGVATAMPTVRVMQTTDTPASPLVTEGPMHFIKDGARLLAITNSFGVGGTLEVANGILRLTAPAEGRLADTVIVRAGATLDLGGNTFACGTLVQTGGTICNGTLAVDAGADVSGGTVAATLVGADLALTGMVSYANSVAATKTLSTNGLVFYMPFDDAATYLTDEGPDKVVLSCQKTNKHGTLGTATYVTSDVHFGAGCLHLDGKSPLVPDDGVFPGHVPTGAAPYTVAFCYKIESGATIGLGLFGYGAQSNGLGNNFQFPRLSGHEDFSVVNNYYWNKDMRAFVGHGRSRLDGKWHSIVSTWDGTICRFYDDGIEIPLVHVSRDATDAPNVTPTFFWVGAALNNVAIKGWLDEIAIFDRAISADEVLAYHLNGVKGGVAPTQTLAVAAGATATVGNTLTDGLVFHMPFESEENFLTDVGPDAVTFSCQTTVKHPTLGTAACDTFEKRFGVGALRLDGKSPLVPVDGVFPAHVPTGAAPYSVAFAFKTRGATTIGLLGYGGRANNLGNNYEWRTDRLNNYYWNNDIVIPVSVFDGLWHTLVSTWDGEEWRYWLDGNSLTYNNTSRTPPNVQTNFFWVGACLNSSAWNGWIDELAIWDRALTEEEALAYTARGIGGVATCDGTARVEVAPGGTLKTAGGVSLAGTLAAAGTIDGDLTLADGVTVEEQSGGTPSVTGRVTIEGTGSFVPCTYPTGPGAEWTVLTALGGFTAGADSHAQTWGIPNLSQKYMANGSASGTAFMMRAYPRGTLILFR